MVKIVVMDWNSFSKMVKSDVDDAIKTGKFKKSEDVIYAESIDAARRLMTNERLKMLSEVKKSRPNSLYSLAKLLKKDIKTVSTDAGILSKAGLLSLENYREGKKTKVRPRVSMSKISFELAI